MLERKIKQKYIQELTTAFEAFEYSLKIPKSLGCTWELVATNISGQKNYAVIFAPRIDEQRNNIRITQKKVDDSTRVVVVTEEEINSIEMDKSTEEGYALVSLEEMNRFGVEMLEAKLRDRVLGKEISEEELDILTSTKEKIF